MALLITLVLTLLLAAVIKAAMKLIFKPRNFPPGPSIIRATMNVLRNGGKGTLKMADQDQKLVGIIIGTQRFVFINDFDISKEAMNRDEFSGRNQTEFTLDNETNGGNYGIIMSEGNVWVSHRRFTLRTLKEFGFGRAGGEAAIQEEAGLFCAYLNDTLTKTKSDQMRISTLFNTPILNVLWQMVISRRFDYEDPFIEDWVDILQGLFRGNRFFMFSLPRLAEMVPEISGLRGRMEGFKKLHKGFQADIDAHKTDLDANVEAKNYVEAFLMEREKNPDSLGDDKHLRYCMLDLFLAGAETTSTTMKWAVLYLALNEDVQNKCREEIFAKIGKSKIVSLEDVKDKLPYCMATMMEVQRLGRVLPVALAHRAMRSSTLGGYDIPEGTLLVPNIDYLMRKVCIGGFDPDKFIPDRFMSRDGLKFVEPKEFIPFGVGKRLCMGVTLARRTLCVFFVTLLQRFRFSPPEAKSGFKYPNPDNFFLGVTRICDDFDVKIKAV